MSARGRRLEEDLPKEGRGVQETVTGRRARVTFAFAEKARLSLNALDFSSFLTLLDHGSDIKELRMRWHAAAAV